MNASRMCHNTVQLSATSYPAPCDNYTHGNEIVQNIDFFQIKLIMCVKLDIYCLFIKLFFIYELFFMQS